LEARIGASVAPVSLRHADKIEPAKLAGVPADTLAPFLCRQMSSGVREFVLLPLFFGRGSALTEFIPETIASVRRTLGELQVDLASELYPMPAGEPRLIDILSDHIRQLSASQAHAVIRRIVLVDHGSPIPQVTAVRNHIAAQLRDRFAGTCEIREAVMERREGSDYDFNGTLLEDELMRMAMTKSVQTVGLAMLFLAPGRHAGPGGDIANICAKVCAGHPGFEVRAAPLIGDHPSLIDLLAARLAPWLVNCGDPA
jgi:sirohydrochlorin ferrochelatase